MAVSDVDPMPPDLLDDNSERFLLDAMARGSAILFTGAGFSADATNRAGSNLPLGGTLRDLLWEIAFLGEAVDGDSSLGEVFEVAKSNAGNRTKELLNDQLLVVDAPAYYDGYLQVPWHKVYTLNLDNLVRVVAGRMRPHIELATASAVRPDAHQLRDGLVTVHLNGLLEEYPDVTFSPPDYGTRTAGGDPLYELLARELYSHPVVYVGTVLDESPLWHHIAMRGERPPGRELRPKSFLVTPSIPVARRAMLERYNVKHIPLDARGFYEAYLAPLIESGRIEPRGAHSTEPLLEDVAAARAERAADLPDFLLGREPSWADAASGGFAIPRKCEAEVADSIEGDACRTVVVSGTAGSGKSTILRRVALSLQAEGWDVRWVRENAPETLAQMRAQIVASGADIVFFDGLERFGARGVETVRAVAADGEAPIVVTATSASAFEEHRVESTLLAPSSAFIAVPNLDDAEIVALVESLDRANRLGRLAGLDHGARVHEFKIRANRQLLVAMIEATSGERFEQKIVNECSALPPELRLAYATTALTTTYHYPLPRDLLLAALSDYSVEALSLVDRLLRQHLILRVSGDRYVARHAVIAREAVSYFRGAGQLLDAMRRLAFALASRVQPTDRRSAERRLLTRLTNHQAVATASDSRVQVREMYQELEPLLRKDPHYWLQRGAYEVERGDVDLAENFLGQARSLSAGDYMVETEWAYLMFRRACDQPRDPQAAGWVDDALDILFDIIDKRGADSPNTYVILAKKVIEWSNAAELSPRERLLLLESVRGVMKEGQRYHADNRQFASAADEIEREYLGLATRRR